MATPDDGKETSIAPALPNRPCPTKLRLMADQAAARMVDGTDEEAEYHGADGMNDR